MNEYVDQKVLNNYAKSTISYIVLCLYLFYFAFRFNLLLSGTCSEIFPVNKMIASAQNNIACITDFVLLTNIAHIEKFLVMENK